LFKFTEDATRLILNYVEDTRKSSSRMASGKSVDEKSLQTFLSDVEDDVKFLAVRLSKARGVNVVERRDVQKAFRKLIIELFRNRKIFLLHNKRFLGDVNFIKERIESSETPRILDVGCGWGRASRRLSKHLDKKAEIVGIDIDIFSLKYGKFINRDFSFVRVHMSYLPFKSQVFDAVVSSKALHEIEDENDKNKALKEFSRILKRSGIVYVFDSFVRFRMARLVRCFLHKIFPRIELYSQIGDFENSLKRNNLGIIRKNCFVWPASSLSIFCSYIAMSTRSLLLCACGED